jgi:hypothetical protein
MPRESSTSPRNRGVSWAVGAGTLPLVRDLDTHRLRTSASGCCALVDPRARWRAIESPGRRARQADRKLTAQPRATRPQRFGDYGLVESVLAVWQAVTGTQVHTQTIHAACRSITDSVSLVLTLPVSPVLLASRVLVVPVWGSVVPVFPVLPVVAHLAVVRRWLERDRW